MPLRCLGQSIALGTETPGFGGAQLRHSACALVAYAVHDAI